MVLSIFVDNSVIIYIFNMYTYICIYSVSLYIYKCLATKLIGITKINHSKTSPSATVKYSINCFKHSHFTVL